MTGTLGASVRTVFAFISRRVAMTSTHNDLTPLHASSTFAFDPAFGPGVDGPASKLLGETSGQPRRARPAAPHPCSGPSVVTPAWQCSVTSVTTPRCTDAARLHLPPRPGCGSWSAGTTGQSSSYLQRWRGAELPHDFKPQDEGSAFRCGCRGRGGVPKVLVPAAGGPPFPWPRRGTGVTLSPWHPERS